MADAKYSGMNSRSGETLEDLQHIRQSVSDILTTPIGTRVMRRTYGSMLSDLIDQPQNDALRLQIMAACYMAILQWEPRIRLTGVNFELSADGSMFVELQGNSIDNASTFSLFLPVS